jgi:hypothetical protein
LDGFDFAGVTESGEAGFCFGEVGFFVAEEVEFGWVVLEEVRADAVAYACAAACDDVGFAGERGDVFVGVEGVGAAEHRGGWWEVVVGEVCWIVSGDFWQLYRFLSPRVEC